MRWACVLVIAGCYGPTVHPGSPCDTTGTCPAGLECRAGICELPGTDDARGLDSSPIDAPRDGTPPPMDAAYIPFGTPTIVPGVDSASTEDDPSFTPDRLTIVFTSTRAGGLGGSDIYLGTRATTNDPFTVAALTTINSTATDSSPEISADGKTIYFTSDRAVAGNGDVYVTTFDGMAWSIPVLATDLTSTSNDNDIAISPDGLTAIVARYTTPHGLWRGTRATTADLFSGFVRLTSLEVTTDVGAPTLTDGAATVYLHAGTVRDIYVAHLISGTTYSTPVPVAELNTAGRDAAPFIDPTDHHIVFNRAGAIYEAVRP